MSSGSSVVPVFGWRCQQVSPEKAVGVPVDASLTPMTGVTSVGTVATMPTTATASAKEAVAAGEGIQAVFSGGSHEQYLPSKGQRTDVNKRVCFSFQVSLSFSISLQVQVPWTALSLSFPQQKLQPVSQGHSWNEILKWNGGGQHTD